MAKRPCSRAQAPAAASGLSVGGWIGVALLALEADGEHLTWGVTGTLGQASGFLLFTDGHAHWLPGATRSTDWMPAGGWQPGMFELSLCAYDHYRNAVGTCSNTVEVEVAINGFGQAAPVPRHRRHSAEWRRKLCVRIGGTTRRDWGSRP